MQVCTLVPQWIELASVLNHIDFFSTLILPFCTIVVLNTLICRTVHRLGRVRRTMTLNTRKRFLNRNHSRRSNESHIDRTFSHRSAAPSQSKVTQMLLVVSTVFICLNLPSYLLRIWVYVNKVSLWRFSYILARNAININKTLVTRVVKLRRVADNGETFTLWISFISTRQHVRHLLI